MNVSVELTTEKIEKHKYLLVIFDALFYLRDDDDGGENLTVKIRPVRWWRVRMSWRSLLHCGNLEQ